MRQQTASWRTSTPSLSRTPRGSLTYRSTARDSPTTSASSAALSPTKSAASAKQASFPRASLISRCSRHRSWHMKRQKLSRRPTTRWDELMTVR
ncbi:MAG: DUF4113 domain-containing protein [Kiritimatiellae bacterium]|nr:DUF4113 domain-containing protein [Kiritimatiellia bacterium]